MIHLEERRRLTLRSGATPGRPAHIGSGSGLVRAGDFLYVVPDDENFIGVFPAEGDAPGELVRVFPGELPAGFDARKRSKPDFEALVRLPAFAGFAYGALLGLGSGSKPNRRTGFLLALSGHGAIAGAALAVDLQPLYAALDGRFGTLNIEGAVAIAGELHLLQRGNKRRSTNGRVRLALGPVLAALSGGRALEAGGDLAMQDVELGAIDGIPLGFSDAVALPDGRVAFTAIAEDTDDGYEDGHCPGAAIGILDGDGVARFVELVHPARKVEGIEAVATPSGIDLLLVTDADDETVAAALLSARL